jgi:hypothetical protein
VSGHKYELDNEGNIILKPVVAYTTSTLAGVAIMLQVRYQDSPFDKEGKTDSICADSSSVQRGSGKR